MNQFKIFAPTMIASRSTDGKLRIEGIASSTIRDHHGDQLTRKALEKMAQAARGMTIFLNHEYKVPEDVFGTVEKVRLTKSGQFDEATGEEIFDLRMGIVVQTKNERAVAAFEQMESAEDRIPTRLGLSIGAMVPDGGAKFDKSAGGRYIIDDVDLVETSLVSMPANPRSWVDYAVKSLAKSLEATGLPASISKQRNALLEVAEAEGLTIVDQVDEDELVPPAETPEEPADGAGDAADGAAGEPGEDDPTEDHTSPEANADDDGTSDDAEGTVDSTAKTRVTVWDGDKTVEVDTGRARPKADDHSAQADEGSEDAGGQSGTTTTKDLAGDADDLLVASTLQNADSLVLVLSARLAAKQAEVDQALEERDAAIKLALETHNGTQMILNKLMDQPRGRKTLVAEAQSDLVTLRDDLYAPDVQKLLLRGTNE